jgi:hypothetical protein
MTLRKFYLKNNFRNVSIVNRTFWLLLFTSLIACNQKQGAKKGYAYYCSPCRDGSCDTTAYNYSGICPVCKMPLIERKINLRNSLTDIKR